MKEIEWTPKRIRMLRVMRNWSQTDLACFISVKQETVSRWENGHHEPGPMARKLLTMVSRLSDKEIDYVAAE